MTLRLVEVEWAKKSDQNSEGVRENESNVSMSQILNEKIQVDTGTYEASKVDMRRNYTCVQITRFYIMIHLTTANSHALHKTTVPMNQLPV